MLSKMPTRERGVTLVELMVAMVISLLASTAMVVLMANTMGTGTQAIQMTRLTQEMRAVMQLMTRDLRRANYHANAMSDCFGSVDCNPNVNKIKVITPEGGDCFHFWLDREDTDETSGADLGVGGFQLYSRSGVNVLQMGTDNTSLTCGNDWDEGNDITDPDMMNVTAFTVSNADSYNEVISEDGDTQTITKLRLTMTASLRTSATGIPISRTMEDVIYVRNHIFCPVGTCP